MNQYSIPLYAILLFATSLTCMFMFFYGIKYFEFRVARSVSAIMLSLFCWSFFRAIEALVPDIPLKIHMARLEYLGIGTISMCWCLMALSESAASSRLIRRYILISMWMPVITLIMAFTNDVHGLLWSMIEPVGELYPLVSNGPLLKYHHGPWFWVLFSYNNALMIAGSIIMFRSATRSVDLYRSQQVVQVLSAVIPWIANICYVTDMMPIRGLDLTSPAFSVSVILAVVGVYRYRFLSVIPIAHDMVIAQFRDGIIVVDVGGRVLHANMEAQRLMGLEGKVKTGMFLSDIKRPVADAISSLKGLDEATVEVKLPGIGAPVLEVRLSRVHSRRGRNLGIIAILRDITVMRIREEMQTILMTALEHSPASVVITDGNGTIEYVNPRFSEITGYSIDESVGRNPRILKSGLQPPEFYKTMWDTILAGGTWRGEFQNIKKSGELYWEMASISPIMGTDNRVTHFVAVKEDITAIKNATDALMKRNASMEEDLASARIVQQSLLPVDVPVNERLLTSYRYVPLESVGGDFFSFMNMNDGGLAVFIADVVGHGVAAALHVSMLKVMSDRVYRRWGESPGQYLAEMNVRLNDSRIHGFITAIYGHFSDTRNGGIEFTFARAGHPMPVLQRAVDGRASFLESKGSLLGNFSMTSFEECSIAMQKGDRLYLYTDGLPEALDADDKLAGYDAVTSIIESGIGESLEGTLDRILVEVNRLCGEEMPLDDLLIIGFEVR